MRNQLNANETSYAGFINGYIAGNLSANSKELVLHKDKINSFLNEVKKDVTNWAIDEELKAKLNSALLKSENIVFDNTLDYYLNLGEILHEIFSFIVIDSENNQIPSNINFNLKKIIYHYLNIAKSLKYRKITKKAKEIVTKFETSANQS